MAKENWEINGAELKINNSQKTPGCLLIGFGVVGIIILIIGTIISAAFIGKVVDGDTQARFLLGMGFFMTIIGLVFVYAGFKSPLQNFSTYILINKENEKISYSISSLGDKLIEFAFSEIAYIKLFSYTQRNKSGVTYFYNIYFVKKDGAILWVDQFTNNKSLFTELAELVRNYTGFAVKDDGEFGMASEAEKKYSGIADTHDELGKSNFVEETSTVRGLTTFRISPPKKGIFDTIILSLVVILFVSAPAFILFMVFDIAPGSSVFTVFISIFVVVFLAILFIILSVMQKDYRITATQQGLLVELKFKFFKFLNNAVFIKKEHIRYIQTNIEAQTHSYLSLVLTNDADDVNKMTEVLMKIGALRNEKVNHLLLGNEKILPLWEVPGWTKPGHGATLADLLYIEARLQDEFDLDEEQLES